MATTFVHEGKVLTLVAPSGGVTAGTPVFIGGVFVIPQETAVATASFDGYVDGVHALTKTASQGWTQGQAIYWDVAAAKADNRPLQGPLIGYASQTIGSGSGDTTGYVKLIGAPAPGQVQFLRARVAVSAVNAGQVLVPAIAGRKYRLVDAATIAIGGAASQPFNITGWQTTEQKLVSNAAAQSTENTLLRAGATGSTILAAGASFTSCDANKPISIKKDGTDVATATSIDVLLSYVIEL